MNSQYDTIIIGAGMSALAAGIRLAHFDQRVCILERHYTIGGLNSFYRMGGRDYDVGLHAMTSQPANLDRATVPDPGTNYLDVPGRRQGAGGGALGSRGGSTSSNSLGQYSRSSAASSRCSSYENSSERG